MMRNNGGRWLTAAEVSTRLNVCASTLYMWRCRGEGPPWHRLGHRMVRYPESELLDWLENQLVPSSRELQ